MRGSPSLGSPSLGSHVHKENIRAAFNPEDAATRPGFKRAARQPLGCERRQNSTEKRTKQLRSFSYLSLIVMAVARAICRSLLYVAAAARERRRSPEMASFWWRGTIANGVGLLIATGVFRRGSFSRRGAAWPCLPRQRRSTRAMVDDHAPPRFAPKEPRRQRATCAPYGNF